MKVKNIIVSKSSSLFTYLDHIGSLWFGFFSKEDYESIDIILNSFK